MNSFKFLFLLNLFRLYPGISAGQYANFIGLRIFDVIIIIVLFYKITFKSESEIKVFCRLLAITLIASCIISLNVIAEPYASIRIPFEVFRMILFLLVFQFARNQSIARADLVKVFQLITFTLVVFLTVRISIPEIADVIMFGEKMKTHSGFFRVFPLTTNPNWCGIILGILLVYSIAHRMPALLIAVLFILLLLTSSRTALIATIVSVIYIMIMQRRYFTLFLCSCSILVALNFMFMSLPSHLRELISSLDTLEAFLAIETLALRFSILEKGLPLMLQSPILGYGNVREIFGLTDNQYLHWLLFGGVFWLLVNIVVFTVVLIPRGVKDQSARLSCVAIIILLAISSLAGNFMENTQIVVLAILLVQLRVIYVEGKK